MWKNKVYQIISEYWNKIINIWIVVFVIIMIIAIKTYINYNTIVEAIDKVNTDIELTNREIAYSENFYKKYLDSEYAPYFLAHKNNTLFYNEMIIRFTNSNNIGTETEDDSKITATSYTWITTMTPQQSRQNFIKSKINN